MAVGSVCWGHVDGVVEDNTRTFAGNWTGTAAISGTGNAEEVCIEVGEYLESEIVETGAVDVEIAQNVYAVGDTVLLKYRHGNSVANCLAASWNNYTIAFTSLGYVQIRMEASP